MESLIDQRDEMALDIEQRNKMILNLTNIKVSFQKK